MKGRSTRRVFRIPPRGFDDPRFDRLEEGDRIHVAMLWEKPLTEDEADRVNDVVAGWLRDAPLWKKAKSPNVAWVYQTSLTSAGLVFTLVNVRMGRAPLVALEERLGAIGIHARELFAGLHRWVAGLGDQPLHPHGTRYAAPPSSVQDYWQKCFDLRKPAPDSERDGECTASPGELRMGRLEIPGIRLCYVTPTPSFLAPDARCERVAKTLKRALVERFGKLRQPWYRNAAQPTPAPTPVPRDRTGTPTDRLERIYRLGRAGYSFSIDPRELWMGLMRDDERGAAFRYREHELFEAVAATVAKEGLEPVVLWRRFGDHLEVQLWEKPASAVSKKVRAAIAAERRALEKKGTLAVLPVDAVPPPRAWKAAKGLGKGAVVVPGGGAFKLALKPDAKGGDTLWIVGGGKPRPVRAPASRYYRSESRVCITQDGKQALVATPCMLRIVDLAAGKVRTLLTGAGYEEVVALADDLALVRSAFGRIDVDRDDPDTRAVLRQAGRRPDEPWQAQLEPALYLVDTRPKAADILAAIIPCRAGKLASLAKGEVVAIWTPYETGWRTAILALRDQSLGVVTTMKEALPDLVEVKGRIVSSNAVELLNVDAARHARLRSLDAIAP